MILSARCKAPRHNAEVIIREGISAPLRWKRKSVKRRGPGLINEKCCAANDERALLTHPVTTRSSHSEKQSYHTCASTSSPKTQNCLRRSRFTDVLGTVLWERAVVTPLGNRAVAR